VDISAGGAVDSITARALTYWTIRSFEPAKGSALDFATTDELESAATDELDSAATDDLDSAATDALAIATSD